MNFSTMIVLAFVAVLCAVAIRSIKKHGLDDCGGNCSSCGHACVKNIQKGLAQARRELEEEKNSQSV